MSKAKRYTKEEIDFIVELREKGLIHKEIAEETNRVFGNNRSKRAIGSILHKQGKAKPLNKYTEKELEFIREKISNHTIEEVANLMTKEFGVKRTKSGVSSVMNKEGIKTGRTGRFKKGDIPENTRELYSERTEKDGYTLIKTGEPDVWEHKHRWLYEQHHNVKLKENEVVIFKDGDRSNLNIDNLIMINRREHLTMNNRFLRSEYPEITETGIKLAKLMIAIEQKKKGGE